ncbi:MAG: hypothetical protein FD180_293 [Planctomycetota bacterium]|nr:MAG: hypothetical protein FD180_293 [Planctomycetota bacterium]
MSAYIHPRFVTLGLISCALLSISCTNIKAHLMARAITNGLYSIESYEAQVTERGLLRRQPGVAVVKTILYERPWKVRAEVMAPAEHAGELFVSDGSTMSIWWPRSGIGLRIRGLDQPSRSEVARTLYRGCSWIVSHYDLDHEGSGVVGGREVDLWNCEPLDQEPFVRPYQAWMDAGTSVPLKLRIQDAPGHDWYAMEFDTIEFGVPVPPGAFRFEFPAEALVFDCDLAGPAVTLTEAEELVPFPILQPAKLPAGHELRKVVLGGDLEAAPIVALLMPQGASWLSLSEMRNTGPASVPEIGIPVRIGDHDGVLNFAFGFTIVSWSVDNTALTLIGNLPFPEMLAIAAEVGSAARPPSK